MKNIMWIKVILFVLISSVYCLADSLEVQGEISNNGYHNFMVTTADDVTIGWDASLDHDPSNIEEFVPEEYDYVVRGYNYERKYNYEFGRTDNLQLTFNCPKTGHWIVEVFLLRISDEEESGVASSIDGTATVNGELNPWWIFAWIAPTGGIIIDGMDGP